MAFRFSLATVLRFRESVEKSEERVLQKLLLEMARVRHEIERVTAGIAGAQEARNQALQQPLAAAHLQIILSEMNAATETRKALRASLDALDREREVQTAKYQAAHRDRQMLSDMFTRQKDAYERERVRADQKFLDDLFASRAQRS